MNTAAVGMNQAAGQMQKAAQTVANPNRSLKQYAQSHVNQAVAQTTYGANCAVIRTTDESGGLPFVY